MSSQHEDKPEFPADEHIEQAHRPYVSDSDKLVNPADDPVQKQLNNNLPITVLGGKQDLRNDLKKLADAGEPIDLEKHFNDSQGQDYPTNPCGEISLDDLSECVLPLPSHANLELTSLEALGRILLHKDCTTILHFDVRQELVNRLDNSLEKAAGIMKYHQDTFSSNPDDTNWYALIAIMAAYQQLKLEVS